MSEACHETHIDVEPFFQGDQELTLTTAYCDACGWTASGVNDDDIRDEAAQHERTNGPQRISYVAHWTRPPTPEEEAALEEIVRAAVAKMDEGAATNG